MTEPLNLNNKIVIYQSEDGKTQLNVKLEGETVWLSQSQMSELFQTDRTVINRHIKNIYKSGELDEKATCAKNAQVRLEGNRTVTRNIPYYNLDVIISVGYRVNSIRGTRFRQWANSVLKQYLIKGYAVNEQIRKQQIVELRQLVQVMGRTIQQQSVPVTDESNALFNVVIDYTYALDTLDNYDLAVPFYLVMRKTILSKVLLGKSIRHSVAKNFTPVWRRKQLCYSTLLRRTIRSVMETSALQPHCSFGL